MCFRVQNAKKKKDTGTYVLQSPSFDLCFRRPWPAPATTTMCAQMLKDVQLGLS